MKKIKKIVAMGMCALVAFSGFFLVGCTTDKDVINAQATEITTLTTQLADIETQMNSVTGEKTTLQQEKERLAAELEKFTVELDEKDKELLEYETKVAEAEDAKVLDREALKDLGLGDEIEILELNQNDLSFLQMGEVEFDGDDYDYQEVIYLDNMEIGVSSTGDREFDINPYLLTTESGSVVYAYEFDDDLTFADISEDEPLEIEFLGSKFNIVEVTEDSFTYKVAQEAFLKEGENITVDGKVVLLKFVVDGKIFIEVDGVGRTIQEEDTEIFGDIQVRAKEVLYRGYGEGMAEIEVGKDVLQTVDDGDEYNEDSENSEDFVWTMEIDGDNLRSVGLSYEVKADDVDEKVISVGENIDFLGYFDVIFSLEKEYEYTDYEFSFDDITDDDVPVVKVTSSEDKGIKVDGKRMDKVYLDADNEVWYKDDGDWVETNEELVLINRDTEFVVSYDVGEGQLSIGEDIILTTDLVSLGVEGEAETDDVYVYGVPVGKDEENLLLEDGVVVESVENNADNDELKISLPDEEVQGVITLANK